MVIKSCNKMCVTCKPNAQTSLFFSQQQGLFLPLILSQHMKVSVCSGLITWY